MESFVLKADERGHRKFLSTGEASSYVAGHPDAFITRHSSFNFGDYQTGRKGFGKIRVFGDETFTHAGCGYNMHPHHDFIIMAFILEGELTHINTLGKVDTLKAGDYYAFSAGSGGKHCGLNIESRDLHVIYVWVIPGVLLLPPTYQRAHFNAAAARNKLVPLVGNDSSMPIVQDLKISRLDRRSRHLRVQTRVRQSRRLRIRRRRLRDLQRHRAWQARQHGHMVHRQSHHPDRR
jgi:quercetin 2,3-dioxygenase